MGSINTLAFGIGPLGPWEILIILVIALLIFGKRLPEVGKSMGKGIVEFKKGLQGIEDEVEDATRDKPDPPKQIDAPGESEEFAVNEKEHADA
jgi:sec-independent protein translocase protein TatA